jgi:hypothetical protein
MRNGTWLVRHSSSSLGTVEVSAASREEALTKMRDELQYRIELCPCKVRGIGPAADVYALGDSVTDCTDDSSPAVGVGLI